MGLCLFQVLCLYEGPGIILYPNNNILFTSIDQLSDTTISYLPAFRKRNYILYWFILAIIIIGLIALPIAQTSIAVTAPGITRPSSERTAVNTAIGGIIDTIYYHEGDAIKKGAILLRIKDPTSKSKQILNRFETTQHEEALHDLSLLTSGNLSENLLKKLLTPLYKEQLIHYLHQKADQDATLKQVTNEYNIDAALLKGKVITNKEYFDISIAFDKAKANNKAFEVEQQNSWQQDMMRYKLELSQYKDERTQVSNNAAYYEIKAPVSGTLQDLNTLYAGGVLQPNQVICTVSPGGSLIAECYVSPKDIGLLKIGQNVRFQVDAFNYNYFGIVTGKIKTIDDDYTVINNSSVFKIRCQFDQLQVHLKNGFTGHLKKGLTFQARFIIGNRTLWQLLWDNVNDWLNPSAPQSDNKL